MASISPFSYRRRFMEIAFDSLASSMLSSYSPMPIPAFAFYSKQRIYRVKGADKLPCLKTCWLDCRCRSAVPALVIRRLQVPFDR